MGYDAEDAQEEWILAEMDREFDAAMEELAAFRKWSVTAGPVLREHMVDSETSLELFRAQRGAE